ncbi:MAG: hypothetical protein LH613_14845 [Chamaesiphon sp.]|nr:hypothetical protein [Chamaesiphon sp.]
MRCSQLRSFKLAELRQDLTTGIEQIDRGQSTEYNQDTLHELFDEIRTQGRSNLERSE